MSVEDHKKKSIKKIHLGILSISSTRALISDESGKWIKKYAKGKGHNVVIHKVIADNKKEISKNIKNIIRDYSIIDVLLLTGGTGLASQDVTIEAVSPLFLKEIVGFGIMFTQLSYLEIGSSSIISRAKAGIVKDVVIFCIPGSINACKLACKKLIFPEIGHIIMHLKE